jgi:hypothetical protein
VSDRRSIDPVSGQERARPGDAHQQGRSPSDTDSRQLAPARARGILDVRFVLAFRLELHGAPPDRRERDRHRLGLVRDAVGVPVEAFVEERLFDVRDVVGDIAKRGGERGVGQRVRREWWRTFARRLGSR